MAKTAEQRRADNAAYMRKQRSENPDKHRAKSKAFTARHRERLLAERNAKYAENKVSIRAKRHGVTPDVIAFLLSAQRGLCAVCGKTLQRWPSPATHVDHCHDTGKVRGLLCRSCNLKEGWVRRYGDRLRAYLETPPAALLDAFL